MPSIVNLSTYDKSIIPVKTEKLRVGKVNEIKKIVLPTGDQIIVATFA